MHDRIDEMIFYRRHLASDRDRGLSLKTVRTLTLLSLAAYTLGALTIALGPDGRGGLFPFELVGLVLIAVSLFAAAAVVGSQFQRIVGGEPKALDEFEIHLRHRAMSGAYAIFTALTLIAVIYAAIGADFGLWVPRSYDAFNGLFWGAFLYACLLPTAVLVWRLQPEAGFTDD
jgi:hypothetical protein